MDPIRVIASLNEKRATGRKKEGRKGERNGTERKKAEVFKDNVIIFYPFN